MDVVGSNDMVLAGRSGLSPERKACLEKASTEAERIDNKESAIEADKKPKTLIPRPRSN